MRNASERKDIRKAEKIAKEIEQKRIDFVVAAMSTVQGRAWFHDLLARCNIFDGTFTHDPHLEAFTKGQRNIGLMIYNDIVANCPDHFVTMMKEANIQEIVYDRRDSRPADGNDADGTADDEYSGSEDADG